MKKAKKFLPVLAIALLILTGFETAYANAVKDSSISLPDFLLRWAEKVSNGNASELARITNQIIQQEKINKDRIASTNGAVLNPPSRERASSNNPLSFYPPYYATITSLTYYTPDTIDIITNEVVGHIDNPYGLENTADDDFAWLKTTGWNEDYYYPIGGEAFGVGEMTGYWSTGDVYITAKTDQPSWDNYVIVSIYLSSYEYWSYLGYQRVTSTSPSDVYIGTTYANFAYVAVECWTPPPHPQYYEPLIMNSVYVDSLIAVEYW